MQLYGNWEWIRIHFNQPLEMHLSLNQYVKWFVWNNRITGTGTLCPISKSSFSSHGSSNKKYCSIFLAQLAPRIIAPRRYHGWNLSSFGVISNRSSEWSSDHFIICTCYTLQTVVYYELWLLLIPLTGTCTFSHIESSSSFELVPIKLEVYIDNTEFTAESIWLIQRFVLFGTLAQE